MLLFRLRRKERQPRESPAAPAITFATFSANVNASRSFSTSSRSSRYASGNGNRSCRQQDRFFVIRAQAQHIHGVPRRCRYCAPRNTDRRASRAFWAAAYPATSVSKEPNKAWLSRQKRRSSSKPNRRPRVLVLLGLRLFHKRHHRFLAFPQNSRAGTGLSEMATPDTLQFCAVLVRSEPNPATRPGEPIEVSCRLTFLPGQRVIPLPHRCVLAGISLERLSVHVVQTIQVKRQCLEEVGPSPDTTAQFMSGPALADLRALIWPVLRPFS